MKKYKCHKVVEAMKIETIAEHPDGAALEDGQGNSIAPADGYFVKHEPYVGGYYVRYEDGYESFSPAEAFEAGYSLLDGPDPTDLGVLAGELLTLLDRIELEGNHALAKQRFDIVSSHGFQVAFLPTDGAGKQ